MNEQRMVKRYNNNEIEPFLREPVLIKDNFKQECNVLNISTVGLKLVCLGLVIVKGERFRLNFSLIDSDISCECIYSVQVRDSCVIGAYVVNPFDQTVLEKALLSN
jgi:hypothetical protein